MRLVQIGKADGERRVAMVDGSLLRLLPQTSVYELVRSGAPLEPAGSIDYDAIYNGESDWRLLPPVDHPEPARCLVSGTGLTHLQSAANRDAMHQAGAAATDSARMYQLGVAEGRPAPGEIGAAPEWFYKGTGTTMRGHGDRTRCAGVGRGRRRRAGDRRRSTSSISREVLAASEWRRAMSSATMPSRSAIT